MTSGNDERAILRLLRRLGAGQAVAVDGHESAGAGDAAKAGVARGLCQLREGRLALTPEGKALLRRSLSGGEGFAAQHQERRRMTTDAGPAMVNDRESPLAWLRSRRGPDGKPLIDPAQFTAGERLRSDFTRGQIGPRITANWGAAVANGRRTGGAGGMADLTDAALAARIRVDRALAAVGPDFAGMLLDFCCFLKGIEEIERERQWPARSAKLVLRLGLSALARHYGIENQAAGPDSGRLRHWGADDYRPEIG